LICSWFGISRYLQSSFRCNDQSHECLVDDVANAML
jgi:hypothetical protein